MVKDERCALLKAYPRAIVHLRSQVTKKRFGAVLGAGISVSFGVPNWAKLVENIAADPAVNGTTLIMGKAAKGMSFPYKTEMLFQRFRAERSKTLPDLTAIEQQNTIVAEWLTICQRYLYGPHSIDIDDALNKHPYLESLIPLVQESALTVNFNFDDYLERSLRERKRPGDNSRGFEAVTDPWPQFRRLDCVVYHPHGYVPAGLMEKVVDRFVFSEASYSKQYVGTRGHDTSFLLTHFARNTCLLIGCSLEDELRNVLMRGAEINPGNYHYYIHWMEDKDALEQDEKDIIAETNFKVYNLITLFLTSAEIKDLLCLINSKATNDNVLKDLAAQGGGTKLKYTFYMTGSIGVGKSTTTDQLRNLTVLDEWQEPRLEILGKPWDTLSPVEKTTADAWIVGQFLKKNDLLRHSECAVMSVVDRPPLDPLVFTPIPERPAKAKTLLDTICPGDAYEVECGVVILLLGDPKELSARVRATGRKDYDDVRLMKMQGDMVALYEPMAGTIVINTQFMGITELTKRVAEVIHRWEYLPVDLTVELKKICGAAHAPAP